MGNARGAYQSSPRPSPGLWQVARAAVLLFDERATLDERYNAADVLWPVILQIIARTCPFCCAHQVT